MVALNAFVSSAKSIVSWSWKFYDNSKIVEKIGK